MAEPPASAARPTSLPVLHVVDDDTVTRTLVCKVGERLGFRAEGFASPAAFLEASAREQPDLVVVDLAIGDSDGIAVLQGLARRRCSVPLIVSSGLDHRVLGSAVRIGRSLGLTMLDPLRKPAGPAELMAALRDAASKALPIRDRDLDEALGAGQLVPYYQPKLRIADRVPVGAEALVRWEHPTRGTLGPGEFLPLAESGASITPLTFMMVERAARDCATWRRLGHDVGVAVNVSARCVGEPDFAERIADLVAQAGIDPGALTLEVTETAAMADTANVTTALARLRIRGFSLSMDDFGTGYSSLAELYRMPFSELKIERGFVSGMPHDRDATLITRAVVGLAKTLGLRTVAEGVETEASLELLAEMGCDVAQGFLIGHPMPLPGFIGWLDQAAGGHVAPQVGLEEAA
ncbi:GGDEF/EAL domain-containing response regulator [Falsiroseomonas oryzae]|uniref:GGDEF/EAL domain-containing response regulator n=1 Tax=Falsiroseomonas oryzae TaxID=2766473 RepID=UPI0022EB48C1|nr:EAL domain-containing response regulator [Roseomonas sp. MO-31]